MIWITERSPEISYPIRGDRTKMLMIKHYKKDILHRLKIARGHFDRVIKMVESDVYCLDITQQTYAIQNALKKIDHILLEHHLKTCVKEAIVNDSDVEEKVSEVLEVFRRK